MAHLGLVNTYTNDAGELVSKRLVPEPYTFDESKDPPTPTGPPPRSFVSCSLPPKPKYLAYVPKKANPKLPYILDKDRVRVQEQTCDHICETCRLSERHARTRTVEAEEPKESHVRCSKRHTKKRKLGETMDISSGLPREEAEDGHATFSHEEATSSNSIEAQETLSKDEGTFEPVDGTQ